MSVPPASKAPLLAALAIAALGASCLGSVADEAFVDSFADLDRDRWYVSSGWVNGDHQGCVWHDSQVRVADGTLVLTVSEAPAQAELERDVLCGEIQTRNALGHGLFEASVRAAEGSGLVFGFFTYTGPTHGNPHDEIDVEIIGRRAREVQLNYFVDGQGGHEEKLPLPVAAHADFLHFAIDWREDALRWYLDGRLIHEVTGDALPQARQKLFFHIWNGTERSEGWLGSFERGALPVTTEVDWVAYTPLGRACAFPRSISCREDWERLGDRS
ncbi:family 16 glycosylhydrolase [Acuticoccus sp.]|uniref:family 16 glycosylhydrolase n=1 Tax=Acuticoccus sp. TaxID=1904378 RepID=UPI003B51E8D1